METRIYSSKYAVYRDGRVKAIFTLTDGTKLMKSFENKDAYSQFVVNYNADRNLKVNR